MSNIIKGLGISHSENILILSLCFNVNIYFRLLCVVINFPYTFFFIFSVGDFSVLSLSG